MEYPWKVWKAFPVVFAVASGGAFPRKVTLLKFKCIKTRENMNTTNDDDPLNNSSSTTVSNQNMENTNNRKVCGLYMHYGSSPTGVS